MFFMDLIQKVIEKHRGNLRNIQPIDGKSFRQGVRTYELKETKFHSLWYNEILPDGSRTARMVREDV